MWQRYHWRSEELGGINEGLLLTGQHLPSKTKLCDDHFVTLSWCKETYCIDMESECRSSRKDTDFEIDMLCAMGDQQEVSHSQRPSNHHKVLQHILMSNLATPTHRIKEVRCKGQKVEPTFNFEAV